MIISTYTKKQFQQKILEWYEIHKRDLPWRRVKNPYAILVSEIMLQQTQVSRVIPKYEQWMKHFPTVESLANATIADVLTHWSGLGYNRRALNLKKTAETIINRHGGLFPNTEKELLLLPGIGKYTAHALLSFAFDKQVPVVDINVKKVILVDLLKYSYSGEDTSIVIVKDESKSKKLSEKELWEIAWQIMPEGKAYDWNQALMDYSSAVLKKEKIHIPKQTTFIGSQRYYRGKLIKLLIELERIEIKNLGMLLKNDYNESDIEWLNKLVQDLVKENFITLKANVLYLAK